MDVVLIIIGILLLLTALAGSVLPVIPGPPVGYCALLLLQFTDKKPFSITFLISMATVVALITILDYIIPVWGTKKFGGSKSGTWGATIGLFAGIFLLPPFGIIIGPFLGAYIGELLSGRSNQEAFRSGIGSFLGFIAGTAMKIVITLVMGYYFIAGII
ncbi:MAG: DUF456 domain-containing protein [Bacteroidales bacterium]